MLRFNLRSLLGKVVSEPEHPSIADKFAQVMVHLGLEYELSPDIWDAAEDVHQALLVSGRSEAQNGENHLGSRMRFERFSRLRLSS